MARTLKVYGWYGFRPEAPGQHRQTREIVLVASKAEIGRITGRRVSEAQLPNLSETGNAEEVAAATEAGQGVILWRGINERNVPFRRDDRRQGSGS